MPAFALGRARLRVARLARTSVTIRAAEVAGDLDRILEYLAQHDPDGAPSRIREIVQAISVLETNPRIGRPTARNMRELIIGRASRGYVALYRYVPEADTVFVLALRASVKQVTRRSDPVTPRSSPNHERRGVCPLRPLQARARLQNATFRPCILRNAASNVSCIGKAP